MEGIKCPVCMAISVIHAVKDGDLVICNYCKAKFTVTRLRRFSILAKEMGKCTPQSTDYQDLEEFVKQLDNGPLLELVRLVTIELVGRYRKKEGVEGLNNGGIS